MLSKHLVDFKKNGFVELEPQESFVNFLNTLSNDILELTPKYKSAIFPEVNHHASGVAQSQRLHNGLELPSEVKHSNPLWGKKITIQAHDFPKSIVPLVEHPYILSQVKALLETEDIVLHSGSLATSYPGNTGEDKKYHSDTANFTDNKTSIKCLKNNRFIVKVTLLLDDVDNSLAPMEVIKETHGEKFYLEINSIVSKRLRLKDDVDNLTQDNWVYDELLHGIDLQKHTFKGKLGSISLTHSSLLQRSTENLDLQKERRVLILNFSRKEDKCFRKYHPLKESKAFINNLENKKLADVSYAISARKLNHYIIRLKVFASRFNQVLDRQINRVKNPKYVFFRISRNLQKFTNRFRKITREYVNIGAGGVWHHEKFYSLDVDLSAKKNLGKINFNLVEDLPLPFDDASIKGVYSSHCLEHLTTKEVIKILQEAYRILKPGGVIRITVPNMDQMFDCYESRDASNVDSFKEKVAIRNAGIWAFDSWLRLITRSFAGHIVDLFSDAELYNIYDKNNRSDFIKIVLSKAENSPKYRNIPNVHKSYWSPSIMTEHLDKIGFKFCSEVKQRQTKDPVFSNGLMFNNTQSKQSFYVEAIR